MMPEWTHIEVGARGQMPTLGHLPDSLGAPAVIVCMHAPGIDEFIEEILRRLAGAGFAAYAPDLYHRQEDSSADPMTRLSLLTDAELQADLSGVHEYVLRQGHVGVGIIGFCMGGRIALIGASVLAPLAAAVSFYGGFVRDSWGLGAPPIERVDSIDCPLLMIGGSLDTNPSPQDIEDLSNALDDADKVYEVEMYEGVGHAFLNFSRPGYQEDTAMRAWQSCERFLKQHL